MYAININKGVLMFGIIYKATNIENGKVYIGKTEKLLEKATQIKPKH